MSDTCEFKPEVKMLLSKECPSSDILDTDAILEYFKKHKEHFEAEEFHNNESVKKNYLYHIEKLNDALWILFNQLEANMEFLKILKFPQLRLMVNILNWFTGDVNHWNPHKVFVCAFPTEICAKTCDYYHTNDYLHVNKDIIFATFAMTSAILHTYGVPINDDF